MPAYDILCVGDVNVDLILSGVDRLPAFGEEVIARGIGMHLGGCTANVATFASRLGMRTALRARVGADDFGDFLLAELAAVGVATEFVIRDDAIRTGITVSLSGSRDRAFVTYIGTIDSLTAADVSDTLLAGARHVHIGSYFMQRRLQPAIGQLFDRARARGLTTSLDTGYDPFQEWNSGIAATLRSVDVFMPNEVEATAIAHCTDPREAARALARHAGVVALKLGEDGSAACGREPELAIPGFAVEVVDTTCCGDAFNAGFLCAMLDGRDTATRLRWGNAAGAIVAGGSGACAERLSRSAIEEVIAGAVS